MTIRIFALLWILLCSAAANAATPPALTVEYSADRRVETDTGDLQGSVKAKPGMERSETRVGNMSSVLILRTDIRKGWLLMPQQKMFREMNLRSAQQQAGAVAPEQTELERVGQESISGMQTDKYKFISKDRSAGGFLWYSASGIPVKMDVLAKDPSGKKTRMTVTLENIEVGPQEPAAFEVPADYRPLPGGEGLFGMLGGFKAGNEPISSSADAEAQSTGETKPPGAREAVRSALQALPGLLRRH